MVFHEVHESAVEAFTFGNVNG